MLVGGITKIEIPGQSLGELTGIVIDKRKPVQLRRYREQPVRHTMGAYDVNGHALFT
jgi:hypothetical protein